ncbi:sodium channel protein type 4 subunit alpha B-like isoform X2 [Clinocottus analis]|uniref:sodium channel protein type 4 subunit alpha B-like isoform X2 n=1 Tax=Clinocottus analis TaxID=304258 RepID=UPI0035BF4B74
MMLRINPAWTSTWELVFTAVYALEATVKVLSRGFCVGRFSFLRDPWNWLDVMAIITGFLSELLDFGDKASVVRTIPRVLKIITVIPGLKTTVGALGQSVKGLAAVLALALPGLSVMALAAMLLFQGDLRHKCVIHWTNVDNVIGAGISFQETVSNSEHYYFLPGHLDALVCGNRSDSGMCPEGFVCLKAGNNPNYGFTSYDSFGWSLLSVTRMMSSYWEQLLQLTARATGRGHLSFFVLLLFPGCFLLVSLLVAVWAWLCSEREEAGARALRQREEEFTRVLEAIKRSEEEEAACRAALSPEAGGGNTESVEAPSSRPACRWSCCGCWRQLRRLPSSFTASGFFDLGVVICLIVNIVFMAAEHFPMTEHFEQTLYQAHLVFTFIFTVEMLLRLVAMDPYEYFQVGWNIFDSILVAVGLLVLSVAGSLRWFLVMRVFRLARWWPSFHMFMKLIWTSVSALRNLTLVLLIMVFLFSVVGMQLFQQDYESHVCRISADCQLPRWHFSGFVPSFLIVTRVLFGDGIEILWDCMEVSNLTVSLIFFTVVLVIGNLLVLNLFLSLLLSSFSTDCLVDPEEESNVRTAFRQICGALGASVGKSSHVNPDHPDNKEVPSKIDDHGALTSASWWAPTADAEKTSEDDEEKEKKRPPAFPEDRPADPEDRPADPEDRPADPEDRPADPEDRPADPEDCCSDKCYQCCPFQDVDKSHGRGRVWSNFRRACLSIVQHECFEIIIIVIIVLSSAALVFEDVHLQHRQVLKMVLARADQVFTCLFLMEMILKWFAFGLKKYFSDSWSWIDFLILQVSVVSLAADAFGFSGMGAFQLLRTFRALGLLRVISRIQSLRVVVQTLVRTVPSMLDFLLVVLALWLVFSITGVNLFAGRFHYCFNETSEEMFSSDDVNNKTQCLELHYGNYPEVSWKKPKLHYDNVLSGFLTLLRLGASSDSLDIMYSAVDATLLEFQPVYEAKTYMYLYFIGFFITSFFTFNFFIRVIIEQLHRDQSAGKNIYRTKEQQKYYKSVQRRLRMQHTPVAPPQNCLLARLVALVTGRPFRAFMVVVICLNLVTLMVETDQQSLEKETVLWWLFFAFIFIFVLEFLLKVVALRQHYFTDGWNLLDLLVLVCSFLGIVLEKYFVMPYFLPGYFIVLRVVHVFRLLYWAKAIRKLLNALMMSLPVLFNISLLLFILMCSSSLFGMFNFAYVKRLHSIDDVFNFETFCSSMTCLLMIGTSASWDSFLIPVTGSPPDCDPDAENPGAAIRGNCGSPVVAYVFFVTHIFLTLLLVVHLYIVVVLETFESEDAEPLSDDHFEMFLKTWKKFDPDASQFIQCSELSDFCAALPDPLRGPNPVILAHMEPPPLPGDRIHCSDVLQALVTQMLGDSGKMNSLKATMEEEFMANPSKTSCEAISSPMQGDEEMAVQSVDNGGGSALQ